MAEPEYKPPENCEVEWKSTSVFCRPHRCDLPRGHSGHHICNCGLTRRNMARERIDDDE